MVARFGSAGLCGCAPEAAARVRASLASLACCVAVFLGFGGAMWSQLTIGWQWSEPDSAGVTVATLVMSGAMLAFAAVAAISPAIWTSYAQARGANPAAYASAAAFAANDAVTHAAALGRRPVRVASGYGDPFYPGVQALARALPPGAVADFGPGCHDGSFFVAQEPPSLAFLAAHLASSGP
jgi:hypothetical protein